MDVLSRSRHFTNFSVNFRDVFYHFSAEATGSEENIKRSHVESCFLESLWEDWTKADWFLHSWGAATLSAPMAVEAGSNTVLAEVRNENSNQQRSVVLMDMQPLSPSFKLCQRNFQHHCITRLWQDIVSVLHQLHSLNIHTIRAQPQASDKADITYSQSNINLHNTKQTTNRQDGAEGDNRPSLNGHPAPLWAALEAGTPVY